MLAAEESGRFETGANAPMNWIGLKNYEEETFSDYTAKGAATIDGANFFFNAGNDAIMSQRATDVDDGEKLVWYFNMKGCGSGDNPASKIGFAAVSGATGDTPQSGSASSGILLGDAVKVWENGSVSATAVTEGSTETLTSILDYGNWDSSIQVEVTFVPSQGKITLRTNTQGQGFVDRIEVAGLTTIPKTDVSLVMFVNAGANFTMANYAVPTVSRGPVSVEDVGNPDEYTGVISGNGGILTKDAVNLGEFGEYCLEFDVTRTASTEDWVGFAIGRASADPSNFGWNADCFNFYYGKSGGGTQVHDANISVGGWIESTLTAADVLAEGRHISVRYNVGQGAYKMVSSKAGTEDIVQEYDGLNFASADGVFMGITTSGSMSMGVSGLRFYTVTEKAEYITVRLIDAIGTVELTAESKAKIDAAENAYNALGDEQKNQVSNYQTLVDAKAAYKELEDAAKSAAQTAIDKINAIGEVALTADCAEKIAAARAAYDGLTAVQQTYVSNYTLLTTAEEAYAELDAAAIRDVEDKITAIGTVVYTDECKAEIDAARAAYDALAPASQAKVENAQTLFDAENRYLELGDADAAEKAEQKIAAIGTVVYTDACKAKIDEARAAYNALSSKQQALVDSDAVQTLENAERSYAALKAAAEQMEADKAAAAVADGKIAAIGTVVYTDECKAKIDEARTAYDALTGSQKTLVNTYDTLETAERDYAALKAAAEQQAADQAAADAVEEKIAAIGTVAATDDSKAKIEGARAAYDALTAAQKSLVENYADLESAEAAYADLTAPKEEKKGCGKSAAAIPAAALVFGLAFAIRRKA